MWRWERGCKGVFAEWRGVDRRDGLGWLHAVRGGDVLYSIRWVG